MSDLTAAEEAAIHDAIIADADSRGAEEYSARRQAEAWCDLHGHAWARYEGQVMCDGCGLEGGDG